MLQTFGTIATAIRSNLPLLLTATLLWTPGCSEWDVHSSAPSPSSQIHLEVLEDMVESWKVAPVIAEFRGLRLLYDTPRGRGSTLAVVRAAVRANHRLSPFDALTIACVVRAAAARHHLPFGFFAATLLQESAFDPDAVSSAGAVGIGQFTIGTADLAGIDPFDWRAAIAGSAVLLGRYVRSYDGRYSDPYATALAAYNAGPGAVAYYHGVPPYPETRDYIADIYDRWARVVRDGDSPSPKRRGPFSRNPSRRPGSQGR